MQRYSKVYDKIPREMLLLKSLPCLYGKCSFCNYILDNSSDLNEIKLVNDQVISSITGEFGVVEIINSGSVFELPETICHAIRHQVDKQKVHTLYFEAYYAYRKRLDEIRHLFPNQEVRYRIGIETFDDEFRSRVFNKPFPTTDITELGREFYGCYLLVCVKGQTRQQILNDIALARANFRELRINVFIDNGMTVTRDEELVKWFIHEVYPQIVNEPLIEIMLDNKDLGVYVQ